MLLNLWSTSQHHLGTILFLLYRIELSVIFNEIFQAQVYFVVPENFQMNQN